MAFCGLDVQRADLDRRSSGLESDARVSEHHDAENDQYARDEGFGPHRTSGFLASIPQANSFLRQSSSLNDLDQHHDNGEHQQEVNEPSHRVTAHQPQQPQNRQDYSNRPQHKILLSLGHGFTAGWHPPSPTASDPRAYWVLPPPGSFPSSHTSHLPLSVAAFFSLSLQTYYVVGRSWSVGYNPTWDCWTRSPERDRDAGRDRKAGQGSSFPGRTPSQILARLVLTVLGNRAALHPRGRMDQAGRSGFTPSTDGSKSQIRTLRDKLIKIGAKVVSHSRYVVFQMAEVAV